LTKLIVSAMMKCYGERVKRVSSLKNRRSKMRLILVVEDKMDEQEKAKNVVLSAGFKVIIANHLEKADHFIKQFSGKLSGIMTDIHFPGRADDIHSDPNGVSVILSALAHGIPCVMCTDDLHHRARHIIIMIERLENLVDCEILVNPRKNWKESLQDLKKIMKGEKNEEKYSDC